MDLLKYFKKRENSKNVAKERLKLVLVHDRSDMSPHLLEMMKADIIKVISKYAEVEESEIDIKIAKSSDREKKSSSELIASIPIIKAIK